MKIDIKSAILGFLIAAMLVLVLGVAEVVRDYGPKWGLIVPANSKVLVRDADGKAFLVDSNSGRTMLVEYDPRRTPGQREQLTLSPHE